MSFASPLDRRYLSFVPSHPAILYMLAVAPLQTSLSSLNPYHSTSLSLGVCYILSSLLPRLLCRFQVRDDKELISLDQGNTEQMIFCLRKAYSCSATILLLCLCIPADSSFRALTEVYVFAITVLRGGRSRISESPHAAYIGCRSARRSCLYEDAAPKRWLLRRRQFDPFPNQRHSTDKSSRGGDWTGLRPTRLERVRQDRDIAKAWT
jgi:hypothetical protein